MSHDRLSGSPAALTADPGAPAQVVHRGVDPRDEALAQPVVVRPLVVDSESGPRPRSDLARARLSAITATVASAVGRHEGSSEKNIKFQPKLSF